MPAAGAERAGSGSGVQRGLATGFVAGALSRPASTASAEKLVTGTGRGAGSQGVFCWRHCQPVQGLAGAAGGDRVAVAGCEFGWW